MKASNQSLINALIVAIENVKRWRDNADWTDERNGFPNDLKEWLDSPAAIKLLWEKRLGSGRYLDMQEIPDANELVGQCRPDLPSLFGDDRAKQLQGGAFL